jgi:integrase
MMGSGVRVTQAAPLPLWTIVSPKGFDVIGLYDFPLLHREAHMVLAMARPTSRPNSAFLHFRKRIPADILKKARGQQIVFNLPPDLPGKPDLVVSAKLGSEVTFSLRTRDSSLAKLRLAAASVQLEKQFQALRTGPQWLDNKQRVAFGGLVYEGWVRSFEGFPGEPEIWELAKEAHQRALSLPASAEAWFGPEVDQLALQKGLVLDAESRLGVIKEAGRALIEVAARLKRNAEGDYSHDPVADRFPKWEDAKPNASTISIHDVFDRWKRERTPAPSTVATWKGFVKSFVSHLGHNDMSRVRKEHVLAWKDALILEGFSAGSLQVGRIAAIKALFSFAIDNALVSANPFDGIKPLRQKRKAGTRMLPYTDDEVARLLALSRLEKVSSRRWIPWLLACTGARVAEIAQLWGCRILQVDGIHFLHIAPAEDFGTLKNSVSEREVPIHPAILEQGFLDFVASKGKGPLFYGKAVKSKDGGMHASKGVGNHLAQWVRKQGFTDKRKAPNHAFRHWFKTTCQSAGWRRPAHETPGQAPPFGHPHPSSASPISTAHMRRKAERRRAPRLNQPQKRRRETRPS